MENGKWKIVNFISTITTPPAIVTHYVHTIASSPSKKKFRGLSAPDGERIASRGWRVLQETKSRGKTWNCRLMRATKLVSRRDEGEIQPVTNLSSLIAQSLSYLSEGEDAVVLALASYKCGERVYPVRGSRRAHLC